MNRGFLCPWTHARARRQCSIRIFRNEMLISYVAVGVTMLAFAVLIVEAGVEVEALYHAAAWRAAMELVVGKSLVAFWVFSGLVYQLTRLGYLQRFALRRAATPSELERLYAGNAPGVTILIPSYKEDPEVVRQTLLAAALQQVPHRHIVLLIDDPPLPQTMEDAVGLARMRHLPGEITTLFAAPAQRFAQALAGFEERRQNGVVETVQEVEQLSGLLREAADWLDAWAHSTPVHNHTDTLFTEQILRGPARAHRARAQALTAGPIPSSSDLWREYRRLAALFKIDVTSLERKGYANLSHEPNKAMNINSYLALMGKAWREVATPHGLMLEATDDTHATYHIPYTDFILVLDADSLILSDYALRLVHFMTCPGNKRVAVVQTPYVAVPGAATLTERIAGATTDVQLLAHQGSTLFGAGSWVGASALVRRAALEDIVVTSVERGYPVFSYIRDRTLNEDTDTTIDLIRKGWTVHNYPDRLAYSATPPDFGALLIQRRRWATGGLLILPNVFRYFCDAPCLHRLWEVLIRAQYILSAPLGSIGLVTLLFYPFPNTVWSLWVFPASLAYLLIFQRDLSHTGHRSSDLFRTLAFNAMLLPINLAGAIHSLQQLWCGRKIPFQRTPKVQNRTAAPPWHILAQFGCLAFVTLEVPVHGLSGEWLASLFYVGSTVAFGYAIQAFIGWRAAIEDIRTGVEPQLRRWRKRLRAPVMSDTKSLSQ